MRKIRATLTRRVPLPTSRPVWAIALLIGLNAAGSAARAQHDRNVRKTLDAHSDSIEILARQLTQAVTTANSAAVDAASRR